MDGKIYRKDAKEEKIELGCVRLARTEVIGLAIILLGPH